MVNYGTVIGMINIQRCLGNKIMRNLALMNAVGLKHLPFIKIINIFADYTTENICGNARLNYIISY